MKNIKDFILESANDETILNEILRIFDYQGADNEAKTAIKKWIKDNNVTSVIGAARKDELDSWRFIDDMDKNLYNELIANEKLLKNKSTNDLKIIYKDGDIQDLEDNDDQDGIAVTICAGKNWISYSCENLEEDFLQIFCLKQ